MKNPSDETSPERLKNLLRRIDESPKGLKDLPSQGEDEPLRRELADLSEALHASNTVGEDHFELDELSRLVKERREQTESWEMPVHLSRCPLCIETFQVLLEGVAKPSEALTRRFVEIKPRIIPFPVQWKALLRIAASIAVVIGAVFLFLHTQRFSAHITEGSVAFSSGKILSPGARVPDDVALVAQNPTIATFADGSKVDLTARTEFTLHDSSRGAAAVGLQSGALVATVAKQPKGREFVVHTPLCDVIVVGTRFQVTCADEPVMVFQSGGHEADAGGHNASVRAVHVNVQEGIVRVKSRGGETRLMAGQKAVLRENEPGIEVSGEEL